MDSEIGKKVRPIYSELQGYLSQAPTLKETTIITDKEYWNQYNGSVEELSAATGKSYDKFKVTPIRVEYSDYPIVEVTTLRQKLSGLISRLHGEYFTNEPPPFSGMPSTVITQSQQQNVSVQMLLEFQSKIDENLSNIEPESKEEGFLKKMKSVLGSVQDVNDLIKQAMKIASEFGLGIKDILALWGG